MDYDNFINASIARNEISTDRASIYQNRHRLCPFRVTRLGLVCLGFAPSLGLRPTPSMRVKPFAVEYERGGQKLLFGSE